MERTDEKCGVCGKRLLKDWFNGRVDVACPSYFFDGKLDHDHRRAR